jgi:hypothetical protein
MGPSPVAKIPQINPDFSGSGSSHLVGIELVLNGRQMLNALQSCINRNVAWHPSQAIKLIIVKELSSMRKHFDFWSVMVIALTLVLFVTALMIKGLTHDLLLEAGVFLVSVKLILMSHKNSVLAIETEKRLDQIYDLLRRQNTP